MIITVMKIANNGALICHTENGDKIPVSFQNYMIDQLNGPIKIGDKLEIDPDDERAWIRVNDFK